MQTYARRNSRYSFGIRPTARVCVRIPRAVIITLRRSDKLKDLEYVKSRIPHRSPFLLVDGVITEEEDSIIAFRDILPDDPVFKGHFPGYPVYPGVLIIEGLAQTAGILLLGQTTAVPLFLGIDKVRFRAEVKPGDRLAYHVKVKSRRMKVVTVDATARVDEKAVATSSLLLGMKI